MPLLPLALSLLMQAPPAVPEGVPASAPSAEYLALKAQLLDAKVLGNFERVSAGCDLANVTGGYAGTMSNGRGNWVPPELRKPHYFEPGARKGIGDFTVFDETGKAVRVMDEKGITLLAVIHADCLASVNGVSEVLGFASQGKTLGFRTLLAIHGGGQFALRKLRKEARPRIPEDFKLHTVSQSKKEGTGQLPEFGAYPTYYILDREGNVAWRVSGHSWNGSLIDRLNLVLLER